MNDNTNIFEEGTLLVRSDIPHMIKLDENVKIVYANSPWFDAKDYFPEPNKKVIVFTCNGKMVITSHDGKYWHGSGTFQNSVTHWCYLPDAPNKDNVL